MNYTVITEADTGRIAKLYMDYYNNHEDGCWKYEKRIKGFIKWSPSRILSA